MSTSRRLPYTLGAFRRRMMMSHDAALFIFVEGRDTDHWFYEKLVEKSPKLKNVGFQIWRIESISVVKSGKPTGGKPAMLAFRNQLVDAGGLTIKSKLGQKSAMFCLDADHDRLVKRTVKCRHVTYTTLPDAEAHILDSADIGEVLASAMSLSTGRKGELLAHLGDCRSKLAERWAEWFLVCNLNARVGTNGGVSPGTPGYAVKQSYGKISKKDTRHVRATILSGSTRSTTDALRIEKELDTQLRSLITAGEGRQLIKGKWLAQYLAFEANKYARRHHLRRITPDQILAAARAIANFRDPWLSYFRRRATTLIDSPGRR